MHNNTNLHLVILILITLLLTSCNKKNHEISVKNGIKIIKNSSKETEPELQVNTNLFYKLSSDSLPKEAAFSWLGCIDFDKEGNIYVLSCKTADVKKFDSAGNFIRSIGKRGLGPGEMADPQEMFINNDTLFVSDNRDLKVVKYNLDGEFLGNLFKNDGLPSRSRALKNGHVLGSLEKTVKKENIPLLRYTLSLMNSSLNVQQSINTAILDEAQATGENYYLDLETKYAFNDSVFFVADMSRKHYQITAYDLTGTIKYKFKKPYRVIHYSPEEMTEIFSYENPTVKIKKNAINHMFCDKSGLLFVQKSIERNKENLHDSVFDIFRDGIFLKTVTLDIGYAKDVALNNKGEVYFNNDRIYSLDYKQGVISVYQLKVIQ